MFDIRTYRARDEIELRPKHLPSSLPHKIVRGTASRDAHIHNMTLPEVSTGASFFAQQAGQGQDLIAL